MQEEWKKEQELVLQLESDIQFKEDQLQKSLKANTVQKSMIQMLKEEINDFQDKMEGMTPR